MKIRWGWRVRSAFVFVAAAGLTWCAAWGQNYLASIPVPPLPDIPPNGAWGEVIMANNKWLVVQNHQKQQFPIAIDAAHIRQFLVRWPISPRDLTNQALVEVLGQDLGNNVVQADHVDVFLGADQNLVAPTVQRLLPNNELVTAIDPTYGRFMSPWDIGKQAMLYGWAYPVTPNTLGIPQRLHVVGVPVGLDPLRLGTPGNNMATVVPGQSGSVTMTQVTHGSQSYLQKGDLVFLNPVGVEPKSLVLQQLVVYKKVPRNEFAP